nr:DAN domain containing protein [Haemonchus contortus]
MSGAIRWRFPGVTTLILLFVTASTVACRPSVGGETPSDAAEPLSVADGYIHFSVANDSRLREKSRKAFESLISEPSQHEYSSQEIVFRPHSDVNEGNSIPENMPEKKERKPGRRKPIVDGRNQALITLKDPRTRETQRCESAKFKQRVKAPGCLTKVIVNRYCHGTCASYFIPRLNSKKLKAVFKSCAACVPRDYDAVNVTLDCPGQDPPQITKSIVKIKKCECIDLDLSTHLRL